MARVEIFRRRADRAPEIFEPDAVLEFESVSLDMAMAQLYRRTEFAAAAASSATESS